MISKGLLTFFYSLCSAILTFLVIEKGIKWYLRRKLKATEEYLSEIPVVVFISGFVEILLYTGSFLVGKPEFIVLWTGVKTALRWDRKNKKEKKAQIISQRGTYHTFLLGTGLNIIFAYISACLIQGELILWLK